MTSRRTTTVSSPAVLNNALVRGQRTGFALLGFISLLVSVRLWADRSLRFSPGTRQKGGSGYITANGLYGSSLRQAPLR